MIKLENTDFLSNDIFNKLLSDIDIDDFKFINDEFLEYANNFKKELIKYDTIYDITNKLKQVIKEKDVDLLFNFAPKTVVDLISNFKYNKSIYYDAELETMTTKAVTNRTIFMAKITVSITKSNLLSSLQRRVIEYCIGNIDEVSLTNFLYKSINRKILSSFKKSLSIENNYDISDILTGKTISDFYTFNELITMINDDTYNYLKIDLSNINYNDIRVINFKSDNDFFIFLDKVLNTMYDFHNNIFIIKNIITYLEKNPSVRNKVSELFDYRFINNDYLKFGIAQSFTDIDFEVIYKSLLKIQRVTYNIDTGNFLLPTDLCIEDIIKYDTNKVYKDMYKYFDENLKESLFVFNNVPYNLKTYSPISSFEFRKNEYDKVKMLIDFYKKYDIKPQYITCSNITLLTKTVNNINNNLDLYNDINKNQINYSQFNYGVILETVITDPFTNEDFDKYIVPLLKES